MEGSKTIKNPLKRCFQTIESMPASVESMDVDKDENFVPREYNQTEAVKLGMKKNTISVLKNEAEKNSIAITMIKEIGKSIKLNDQKKLIIFSAPTVQLIHEQFEVIKFHTELKVEEYYGAKGVDQWDSKTWEKEIAEHDILVMTPQILLDALRKAFLSLNTVCLMILDECHCATGNHPYTRIMKEFYHKSGSKPKIFGLTSSSVIRKGVSSMEDCEGKISELESLLDSQIYMIEDSAELDVLIPSAKENCRFYDQSMASNLELKKKLDCSRSKFDAVLRNSLPVEATGASVTAGLSVDIIHRYCANLPGDKSITPQPKFKYLLVGNLYQCEMTLPPNPAFETIIGTESGNMRSAKQLVCLEACKKLHQMGALDDHLLSINEKTSKNDSCPKSKPLTLREGTTKRKELHGKTGIRMLSGTWGDKHDGAFFESYKLEFSCNIAEQRYSSFILLIESKLDSDVGNIELELFLLAKFVHSSVSASGRICLQGDQVAKAKCFQEFFFNGLFGKLFIKSSGKRQFLFQNNEVLWDASNMYLLLPLDSSDNKSEPPKINWRVIESSVSAVEFLKKHAWLNVEQSESNRKAMLEQRADPVGNESENRNIIHLANKSVSITDLKDIVVVAIHTGRIYTILEAVDRTSGESCFDGNSDTFTSNYSSFFDYFRKKYGITLVHRGQPLLLLKQSHNAHNLLVDFRNQKKLPGESDPLVEKPRNNVHIPPELLVSMDVTTEVLKAFYLLPSLMHRLESLMLASQLREDISSHYPNMHISSSLILEALTTLRCSESFSMERLELLGDSVLKYAVSCHLFLNHPEKHEGQLSSERSRAVCNFTLHKLGINRKLQGYIRDTAFDPRRWTAPGQQSIRLFPCEHGVATPEVPLDKKFITEDTGIVIGKCCDNGHRWMGSKTISDCVEALIGAYYVGGGLNAAIHFMIWLGMDAQLDPSLVDKAITSASLHSYYHKVQNIQSLEMQLGYQFAVKGLLLEAITHETEEQDVGLCYQRLEFLGDSVLDILITWYLYKNHSEIDPGELTDLRSASVNNDNFALAAVRHNLHLHLQHCSGFLEDQISKYVNAVSESSDDTELLLTTKAPKVLGDLVESLAGAVLIDSKLDLDEVWRVFKPLLPPIVTPEKLELPPLRELIELCDSLGYFIKENCTLYADGVQAELVLQLEEVRLVGNGFGETKKAAKGQAALRLLKNLEKRGISNPKCKKEDSSAICIRENNENTDNKSCKKQKIVVQIRDPSPGSNHSNELEIPVIPPIAMKKGGPRTSLFDLCKKLQWPMPDFQFTESRSRIPIVFGEGSDQRQGFNSFESQIKLTIPNSGVLELTGDPRADKKSASDSAALQMLHELERQGRIIISK